MTVTEMKKPEDVLRGDFLARVMQVAKVPIDGLLTYMAGLPLSPFQQVRTLLQEDRGVAMAHADYQRRQMEASVAAAAAAKNSPAPALAGGTNAGGMVAAL